MGCDKRLKDMGLLHVKLPTWRAKEEAGTSKSAKVLKTRVGGNVGWKGDKRKKWMADWLTFSGHVGCDCDAEHDLMKQRRPHVACLSHHLSTQYYGIEDGDDEDSKKTYVLCAGELPEAGHAPPPPPDLSDSSLRLGPKIRGIAGSLPFSLPLLPFSLPLLFIIHTHTQGELKRKAGDLSAADVQVQTLFSAHVGIASELEKRQREVESTTKELTDVRKSLKESEAKKKKTEKVLKDTQKELESRTKELEDTQMELESYETHVMECGTAASPVALRPASSINPPVRFFSPPESGLLRKAAPSSSEVSYVLCFSLSPSLASFRSHLSLSMYVYA
jgi:hypothetical protein